MNEDGPRRPEEPPLNKVKRSHTPSPINQCPVPNNHCPNEETKDQRVSEVTGERVCSNCGFNLFGQPILREHYYNMLIVRCPECGTVASLQEYPLLGKWAGRWSKLLAAGWLLTILLGVLITTAIIGSTAESISIEVLTPCSISIGKSFQPYRLQNPDKYGEDSPYTYWYNRGEPYKLDSEFAASYIDGTWWSESGKQTFLQSAAYHGTLYDWSSVYQIRPSYLIVLVIGIIWSIILIGTGRWRLIILLFLIGLLTLAATIMSDDWSDTAYGWAANVQAAQTLSSELVGQPVRFVIIAIFLIPMALGMIFGRTIVRWLVIAVYPPGMRGWLAFLWIADGKTPPKKTWLDR